MNITGRQQKLAPDAENNDGVMGAYAVSVNQGKKYPILLQEGIRCRSGIWFYCEIITRKLPLRVVKGLW